MAMCAQIHRIAEITGLSSDETFIDIAGAAATGIFQRLQGSASQKVTEEPVVNTLPDGIPEGVDPRHVLDATSFLNSLKQKYVSVNTPFRALRVPSLMCRRTSVPFFPFECRAWMLAKLTFDKRKNAAERSKQRQERVPIAHPFGVSMETHRENRLSTHQSSGSLLNICFTKCFLEVLTDIESVHWFVPLREDADAAPRSVQFSRLGL